MAILAIIGMGIYAIWFGRYAYRSPDVCIARWYVNVPQAPWSWRLVRGGGAFEKTQYELGDFHKIRMATRDV